MEEKKEEKSRRKERQKGKRRKDCSREGVMTEKKWEGEDHKAEGTSTYNCFN